MLHTLLSLAVLITSQAAAFAQGQTPTTTRPPAPSQFSATYRVGSSDVLGIKVFGEEELSNKYTVDTDGSITFPLIGRFHVGGKTTREIEEGLTKALVPDWLKRGQVSVEIAQYRPYYILGEVKKSGEYPYRHGLPVPDTVASAGGFTYRANESKVYLRRAGAGREEILPLDAPVPVFPGDNIRIPERYF